VGISFKRRGGLDLSKRNFPQKARLVGGKKGGAPCGDDLRMGWEEKAALNSTSDVVELFKGERGGDHHFLEEMEGCWSVQDLRKIKFTIQGIKGGGVFPLPIKKKRSSSKRELLKKLYGKKKMGKGGNRSVKRRLA